MNNLCLHISEVVGMLQKKYDVFFIQLMYSKQDTNLFYSNLFEWLKIEKANEYDKNNQNHFSKLFGIVRTNPEVLKSNSVFHLNKTNVDAISTFLIDSLFNLHNKQNIVDQNEKINYFEQIKKLFFETFTFDLFIKEIVFLGNFEDNEPSEYPMNFYSFAICLRLLNDILGHSIKTVTIGVTDYFHYFFNTEKVTIMKNEIFYYDLYFCYIAILLFIKDIMTKHNNFNLSVSISSISNDESLIENYTFNSFLFSEFCDNFVKEKKIENFNILGLIKNLRIDVQNFELNLLSDDIENNLKDLQIFKNLYNVEGINLHSVNDLSLSVLINERVGIKELIETNEEIKGLTVPNLSIKFLSQESQQEEDNKYTTIDISKIIQSKNVKSLTIGGENITITLNNSNYDKLSKFYLFSYNTKIEDLSFLNKLKTLTELSLKTISNKALDNLLKLIPSFTLLRSLDLSISVLNPGDLLNAYKIINQISSNLPILERLKLFITTDKYTLNKEDFGVYFIHVLKNSKRLQFTSLIVNNTNICTSNFKESGQIFDKEINKEDVKIITKMFSSTNTSWIYIENLTEDTPKVDTKKTIEKKKGKGKKEKIMETKIDTNHPIFPKRYDWNKFESILLALQDKHLKENYFKLRRKPILVNLFKFLAKPVNKIFFAEFVSF